MSQVSLLRLYLLRALYLLLILGLGLQAQVWEAVINRVAHMELMQGIVTCMLCAMSLLAIVGLRYPLQMLPLLFFEITWKTVWLVGAALRQWYSGGVDPAFEETLFACVFVVPFWLFIPWKYVYENYGRKAGDPWR